MAVRFGEHVLPVLMIKIRSKLANQIVQYQQSREDGRHLLVSIRWLNLLITILHQ